MTTIKELKTGIWSNAELAEWFGDKETTFRRLKNKRLETLKEYCDFERILSGTYRGKIRITKVFNKKYTEYKKPKSAYAVFEEQFLDEVQEYDIMTHLGSRLKEKNHLKITDETAGAYAAKVRREYYGSPRKIDTTGGSLGTCRYSACYANKTSGGFRGITKAEWRAFYQQEGVKEIMDKLEALKQEYIDAGIPPEYLEEDPDYINERDELYNDLNFFMSDFFDDRVVIATKIEPKNGWGDKK